ncbi:MAG: glycosyltransferase family 2 protein [Gemmatimonadota bacterium]|jgi:cellulose synthase/poly-beta-1,6-N-acetylglucosamine synthase-like glycosyltransferase
MVSTLAYIVLGLTLALGLYTYVGYPALLWLIGRFRQTPWTQSEPSEWPHVSVTIPVYNERAQIRDLVESLLAIDYPRDRLQILVVSDASSDGTDEIVREYSAQGIELLRMPERGGKTRAENAAADHLRGDIVVNTDASIRIRPEAIKRLVRVFQNPRIGLASGRDVSFSPGEEKGNLSESGYVGYEMAIRDLETRVGGIIGASGCFYAIRPALHRIKLPDSLSRDFASALHTRENGYVPVSVPDALCLVPRTDSLEREYRRKVRTITRGMETLWHKRNLLNPFRFGSFALKLLSHKICRWMLPWAGFAAWAATWILAPQHTWALVLAVGGLLIWIFAAVGWWMARLGKPDSPLTSLAFVVAGNLAAAHALLRVLHGDRLPIWEPTRR